MTGIPASPNVRQYTATRLSIGGKMRRHQNGLVMTAPGRLERWGQDVLNRGA